MKRISPTIESKCGNTGAPHAGHWLPVRGVVIARASCSSSQAGRLLSILFRSSAGVLGSVLAAGALFDALLCCQGCAESGKGTLERARGVNRWCQ